MRSSSPHSPSQWYMKPFYKNFFNSKIWSLGSKHGQGPASASNSTASWQVTAGISLSFQLCTLHLWSIDLIFIEQTAHDLAVSSSVSALEISDIPPVSFPAAGVNLVYILYIHSITTIETAHDNIRVFTLVSALAINDLAPVSVPAVGINVNVQPSPSLLY